MLSLNKQFLFIHVPKTAGNSIQNVLRKYSEDKIVICGKHQDGVERFEVRNDQYEVTKHSSLKHYQEILDPHLYRKVFKFATIRNPYDRMVSWYFSPHRGVKEWSREDFINLVREVPAVRDYIAISDTSSLETIIDKFGLSLKLKPPKLDQDINFLMRFESLEQDFKKVCQKINIPHEALPIRNRAERKHYKTYLDQELKEMIDQKFQDEIEFGDYEF